MTKKRLTRSKFGFIPTPLCYVEKIIHNFDLFDCLLVNATDDPIFHLKGHSDDYIKSFPFG